jgi:hypothetical protein
MPEIATELLALKPDLLTGGLVPTLTYVKLTDTISIVMASVPDPVGLGLIASYARPGGNVTGTSRTGESMPRLKELEFLRELVPALARLAVAFNPNISAAQSELRDIQTAARSLGIDAQAVRGRERLRGCARGLGTRRNARRRGTPDLDRSRGARSPSADPRTSTQRRRRRRTVLACSRAP